MSTRGRAQKCGVDLQETQNTHTHTSAHVILKRVPPAPNSLSWRAHFADHPVCEAGQVLQEWFVEDTTFELPLRRQVEKGDEGPTEWRNEQIDRHGREASGSIGAILRLIVLSLSLRSRTGQRKLDASCIVAPSAYGYSSLVCRRCQSTPARCFAACAAARLFLMTCSWFTTREV